MDPGTTLKLSVRHMVSGDVIQREFERLPVTIGRESTNRLQLANAAVSRNHASLEWSGGRVVLTDLGSSNGTYHRGFRIPAFAPLALGEDFLIAIGPFVLRGLVEHVELSSVEGQTRALDADRLRLLLSDAAAVTVARRT